MASSRRNLKEFKKKAKSQLAELPVEESFVVDIYEKANNAKDCKRSKTGLVFDEQFARHECPWDRNYPENPERYTCILRRITEYGLLDRCERIESQEIDGAALSKKHDGAHINLLKTICSSDDVDVLEEYASRYDSIYFNKETYKSAILAAGSGINLVKAILEDRVQNGMAIIRPPGHHAMRAEYCGFCFFNNIALAAQFALDKHDLRRVLIVDWDVHHGQATQQMFYDDPRLLYFSIHRYEHGNFWPCLRESEFDHIGEGKGLGYNINIPLNETGCGDADYLYIFNNVLLPVAYEYQPELVLISAGYDAAIGCPEGCMKVTPGFYANMTNMLMGLSRGKLGIFLEGGYFPPSLSESAALTLGALLGDVPPAFSAAAPPKETVRTSVLNAIYVLRPYWKCFGHYDRFPDDFKGDRKVVKHTVRIFYQKGEELTSPFPTRDYYIKNTPEEMLSFTDQLERLKIGGDTYNSAMQNKVGYCYDPVMLLHKSPKGNDYEKPERLTTAINILREFGLLERMIECKCPAADQAHLQRVHADAYLDKLGALKPGTEADLLAREQWVTVFSCKDSMKSALCAAGSVVQLVNDIAAGIVSSAVALVRPPGHHAENGRAGGFCLLNNVAVAAQYATLDRNLERVMILDWDVHHGNGTQDMFINNPRVLYMSMHRYDHGDFYPNSRKADFGQVGKAPAEGFNVNVAWNDDRMADADYMAAFFRIVLPIAYEFRPSLLLISAGFDAAVGDPLGGYNVTPEAFGHFVQLLRPTCGGKIIVALEGGYNCNSVGYSVAMCCKALLGDPLPPLDSVNKLAAGARRAIANTVRVHRNKWNYLQPHVQFDM